MAGKVKGKQSCGIPVRGRKTCTGCGSHDQWVGRKCTECKRFLPPWCEALVYPGERCRHHQSKTDADKHPDAPIDEHSSFLTRLSPENLKLYKEVRRMSLGEISYELACMATVKALKEPDDLRIVSAASGVVVDAARVKDLERSDDGVDSGDSHVTIVVKRSNGEDTTRSVHGEGEEKP